MPDSTNTGGRKPRVTDDDLLDVFRATADPVLSTAEVADAVPIKRRGTLNRLRDLEDAGRLDSKQIGGRNTVWWLVDDVARSRPTPDQSPTNSDAVDGGGRTVDTAPDDPPPEDDTIANILDGWRPGRSPNEKREQRRAAGRAALLFLWEQRAATAAEFKKHVEPEYPVDGQSPATWWKKTAREALDRARDAGVVGFKDGVKEWRWLGSESGVYDPTEEFDQ